MGCGDSLRFVELVEKGALRWGHVSRILSDRRGQASLRDGLPGLGGFASLMGQQTLDSRIQWDGSSTPIDERNHPD